MPQMAPLNWLTLFLMFIIMFLIFNSMNFYSFTYLVKEKKISSYKLKYNWKW